MAHYAIHGLTIASDRPLELPTSLDLPGTMAPRGRAGHIEIRYVAQLPVLGQALYEVGRADDPERALFAVHERDGALTMRFPNGVAYRITDGGRVIECAGAHPHEALASVLTEIVIPRVLQLHGLLCFHASAVQMGDRALALTAPSGMGKSTIVTALCARGHALICDDSLAVSAAGDAHPGPATVRLWDDSAATLLDDATTSSNGEAQRTRGGKLQIRRAGVEGVVPLGAVCCLEKTENFELHRLGVGDAVATLTNSLHRIDTRSRDVLAREFESLTTVAQCVPVWQVGVPHDFDLLPDVCGRLEQLLVELDESAIA